MTGVSVSESNPRQRQTARDDTHAHEVPLPPGATIITIDGPAGTGKSSVARQLAKRLGLDFLDTGAMYRAAAAIVLDHGINPSEDSRVVEAVLAAGIRFDWTTDPPAILAGGRAMGERIRSADVTGIVSRIAANSELRRYMVAWQRRIAHEHPRLVTEGRDQGSVVFPSAPLKFYLDAAPRVRAARRTAQLRDAGQPVSENDLLDEILTRDRSDSSRVDGPLTCPDDAIRIDTSTLTFDQVVDVLERHVRQRIAAP